MLSYEASKRSVCELRVAFNLCLCRSFFPIFIAVLFTGCAANEGRRSEEAPGNDAAGARTTTSTPPATPIDARQSSSNTAADAGAYPKKTGLTHKERAAWREILKWPADCEDAFATTHNTQDDGFAGLEFYELSDRRYLVEVACAAGAYQGSQVYVLFDESKSPHQTNVLSFQNYVAEDEDKLEKEETAELWGTATFDARSKQLTMLNKYRGPGDCGALAAYGFEDGTPKLLEFRAKTKCDGRGAENPKQWKKVLLP